MMKKIIPLSELPLSNDFMFGEIMSRKEIAKLFLEDLLNAKIARLEYVNKQEMIEDGTGSHGIRLDIYLQDNANTMYDVEIQTTDEHNLERRSRYYQQKIDARTLRKNADYSELPDSYVIFVCTFDYFKRGLAAYKKKSILEDCDLEYDDGSHVIFLNSAFSINNTSLPIEEFLKFLQTNDSDAPYQSELAKKVVSAVNEVRNDTSREGIYMTFATKLEENLKQGLKQGRADIILKLAQKFSAEEIAAMLEESVDYIQGVISEREN